MSGFTKRKPTLFAQKGTIWISKRRKNFKQETQSRKPTVLGFLKGLTAHNRFQSFFFVRYVVV